MNYKEQERKKLLISKGYLTVNKLIEKLQELKNKGCGELLVGNDCEHYKYCDYDEFLEYVVVC